MATALAGCTSGQDAGGATSDSSPDADEVAVERTIARSRGLLSALGTVDRSGSRWTKAVERVAAGHRAHLLLLNVTQESVTPSPTGTGAAQDQTAAASGSAASPSGPTASGPTAPEELVTAQRDAARQALEDLSGTSAPVAVKLARIAAARAVQADLLAGAAGLAAPGDLVLPTGGAGATDGSASRDLAATGAGTTPADGDAPVDADRAVSSGASTAPASTGPTARSSLPQTTLKALSTLLEGEHAAVFAYGTITARIPSSSRARAQELWNDHVHGREEIIRRIRAGGGRPPAASAAYGLGTEDLSRGAGVRALAADVEDGLASVAIDAVGQAEPSDRVWVAQFLVRAARDSARWSGDPPSLPG